MVGRAGEKCPHFPCRMTGNNSALKAVSVCVPADTHLAGLGSERDFQTVPPANGPKLLESFGSFFVRQ